MSLNPIIIDLFGIDPKYAGGVSRFSLGLVNGIIKNLGDRSVKIICNNKNVWFIKERFPNVEILIVQKYFFDENLFAIISILAWILRCPNILLLSNLFRFRQSVEMLGDYSLIAPTSTINFYKLKCSILCIHDIQHEICPENFTLVVRAYRWAQYRLSAQRAEAIQVSSDFIAANLREAYGAEVSKKIFKAYEGFNEDEFSTALSATQHPLLVAWDKHFVYYPAQLWKHKNHSTVIRGIALFNSIYNKKIGLVLTGQDFGELERIMAEAKRCDVVVKYLGLVDDSEMRWLYRNSVAVLAAGYHESSCLPIREAIACNGIALAAAIPPNQEVSFLQSLILFDTFSPDSFAKQLWVIVSGQIVVTGGDSGNSTTQNAQLFKLFEWKSVASTYLDVLYGQFRCKTDRGGKYFY